jgi:hypothetical protein
LIKIKIKIKRNIVLPPFQIVSHFENLGESKPLKLIKIIEKIIKTYDIQLVYHENIINMESNDT